MPTYSAEAVVLRRANFGEADQVVTLLTQFQGKVSAVAKGVKKIGSRKGGNLDLLNHVKAYLAEGKNLDIITEVELVSAYPKLKSDLEKISIAYQIVELVNEFLTEHQENQAVFRMTVATLELLETTTKPELVLRAFQLKLLHELGFLPELNHCVRCGQELPSSGLALSAQFGGLIGPEEREDDIDAYPVSSDTVKALRYLVSVPLPQSVKLGVPDQVARQLARALQYYLEYLLEKALKSPQLHQEVKKLNG